MIRPYDAQDLGWLADVANKAWRGIHAAYRKAYGETLYQRLVPNEHFRKGEEMSRICRDHPESVFICEEDGRKVGFVTILLDRKRKIGEICNNAVDPDCGLKGIGQQMYRFALEEFRKQGMEFAKVQTGLDEGHAPARKAYERAGFNISHSDITYYQKLSGPDQPG
jgi:ribosomal protein S18 acetylase RimI-like enzyme